MTPAQKRKHDAALARRKALEESGAFAHFEENDEPKPKPAKK